MTTRIWSAFQQAVFDFVRNGTGNAMVDAVAGSGKTTTILEALNHIPAGKRVLFVAFNKSIATELKDRVERSGHANVTVSTLHSLGLRSVTTALGRPAVDVNKADVVTREICNPERLPTLTEWTRSVAKAVSLSKSYLADSDEAIDAVIDTHQLVPPASLEERPAFIRAVQAVLSATKANQKVIDFDDMIWFPAVLRLKVPQYDFVLVDETQDLNAAQIALVLKAVKPAKKDGTGGGRVIAVGDPRQAIYGFRGAADGAFDQVRIALKAIVLPLSVTYRCARAIVNEAARYVPHIEAAPDAVEGLVSDAAWTTMMRDAQPGDFILSRINAPLLGLCLNFLREGRKAAVQGRDIGTKLCGLIKRSGASDVEIMLSWVNDWTNNEVKRLAKLEKDATAIIDQRDCIEALCEGETKCWAVIQKIERLFADGNETSRITLSTTHKAKGMERNCVWLLRGTYFLKAAEKSEQRKLEEQNLYYVAVTRARETLYLVESKPR